MAQLRFVAVLYLLVLIGVGAQPLLAGPNRASRVNSTPEGRSNVNLNGTDGTPLSEDPTSNFCKVEIGPNKRTWVEGHGVITIIPSGTRWTQEYGLWGWDKITRLATITGCEQGHWTYSATVWMRVRAEAQRNWTGFGSVKALAYGKLQAWENGKIVGEDYRECTVATGGTTGYYDVTTNDGVVHTNAGYMQGIPWNDSSTFSASQICLVTVPAHDVSGLSFELKYLDFGWVELHTHADFGHTKSDVNHETTPDGTTNTWKVHMSSWDDDQVPSIRIEKYTFDGDVDQ